MKTKKELLWQIIVNAEKYLLHNGWSKISEQSYAEHKASVQSIQQAPSSYSFLQSVAKIPALTDSDVLNETVSNQRSEIFVSSHTADSWSCLMEDVAKLHFYPLPAQRSAVRLMMIFSYAENKFEEIQEYAQKWLDAIGVSASDVYFTSVYKTYHPVGKVVLTENEIAILEREVKLVAPQFLLVTGRLAYEALFKRRQSITKSRMYRHAYDGIPSVVTYDPELVLQYPMLRRDVWRDLQKLKQVIEKKETSPMEVSN